MLNRHAKSEWITILIVGLLVGTSLLLLGHWILTVLVAILTLGLMAFFRDPERSIPTQRSIMTSPADGKISSIHDVAFFEPFNGPALCIRIFLSILDVHVNRSPAHGVVCSVKHKPGKHLNAMNPDSAQTNESNLIVLVHPLRRTPVAAIRQVAGLLARTITCTVKPGDVLQRGQRIGIIKLGSTTELYIPQEFKPEVKIAQGDYVYAGSTILAYLKKGPSQFSDSKQKSKQTRENQGNNTPSDDPSPQTENRLNTDANGKQASPNLKTKADANTRTDTETDDDVVVVPQANAHTKQY